jgi:ribose transport system substrate-binding protein
MKTVSKRLCLLLAVMLLLFAGCAPQQSQPAPEPEPTAEPAAVAEEATEQKDFSDILIGYCVQATTEPFLANLTNEVQRLFAEEGITVQIASAGGDAATQISQIENFASMGADLIILMPVDPTSVGDAIRRAQAQGSKVMVSGADPGVYDAITWIDQFMNGEMMAEMAADWIDVTFPDAAPGSIEVAILEARDTPPATDRSEGMHTIESKTDKVKLVATIGTVKTDVEAIAAAENVFQSHPNVKVFLTYNSGGAIGVNEFAMRPGSPVTDKENFGVFASDVDPQIIQALRDSADGNSVVRGIIQFGGASLPRRMHEVARMVVLNETDETRFVHALDKITLENVGTFD